jgi:uncharacterized protein
MNENTLFTLMRAVGKYLQSQEPIERFVLYWHGGEPLLANLEFFRNARKLQDEFFPTNIEVVNTIQTNGMLLNDEWATMIKENQYGVCVSLDGPPEIHDAWRRTKNNKGTFANVVHSIETLQINGISPSILSVISPEALPHGARIYSLFRKLGCVWMDFMYPFYSRIDNTIDQQINPSQWGEFLVDVFDAWMAEENPSVTVRLLEDMCMMLLDGRTQMCISGTDCSYVITVYPNGNVYICDDLLSYGDSLLGNIHQVDLATISRHPLLMRLHNRDFLFGSECKACDLFSRCKGGCTLFRAREQNDFQAKHFYCASQRRIITHIDHYFRQLANNSLQKSIVV